MLEGYFRFRRSSLPGPSSVGEHRYPLLMAGLGAFGCQPQVDNLASQARTNKTGSESQNVRIVVLSTIAGARQVVARAARTPGTLFATMAEPVQIDGALPRSGPAAGYGLCHGTREHRVVHRLGRERADVLDLMANLP